MKGSLYLILFIIGLSPEAIEAQINDSWNLTVGGQSIQANPDGSFRIPNISSPDLNADFIADDYVRLTGYSLINGNTQYVYSDYFKIESGQTVIVPELIFTPFAPPNPESIQLGVADGNPSVLTQIGQSTQLQVLGKFETLPENCNLVVNSCDLTSSQNWTTYRSSNSKIASVDFDGRVTANGCGVALITAKNDGVTSVTKIIVSSDDELTTVEGFVFLGEIAQEGVSVTTTFGQQVFTDEQGMFSIENVPTNAGPVSISALLLLNDTSILACLGPIEPVPGGITDVGIVQLDAPSACTLVESTFDTSAEGWTSFGDGGSVQYIVSGGNPGGYISIRDQQRGAGWWWNAPPKFLGDQTASYGASLRFDWRVSHKNLSSGNNVVLFGSDFSLRYSATNPGVNWSTQSIRLHEDAGWTVNGVAPSREEFLQVLRSVSALRILGEYSNTRDTGYLDNISIRFP